MAVNVFLLGESCETRLNAEPIPPRGQAHFASWAGQRFRIRRSGDAAVLMQHVVGEVIVRPCTASSTASDLTARAEIVALQQQLAQVSRRHAELLAAVDAMHGRVAKCEDRLAALEMSGHDRSQLSRSEEERPSAAKGGRAGLTSDVAARRWDGGGLGSVSEHERWKSEL